MTVKRFDEDTIVAISTPLGEGALGVIRLSGKNALRIADQIFRPKSGKPVVEQPTYTLQYGHVVNRTGAKEEAVVDEAVIAVMRAPASFTKEDVVEISAHGGPAILQAILGLAIRHGARSAERGEFTKRAFLNGRLDLLQAEAVLDLVSARTEPGLLWAARQLDGALSRKIKDFKNELLEVLTHLEAQIDFPEDSPDTEPYAQLSARTKKVLDGVQGLLAQSDTGILLKRGLSVVICGRPNVGKSSLFNALSRANRVIVTPYAGTTRDVVEADIQIQGLPVRLYDTAGLRQTDHPIEKEGIERTKLAVKDADVVIYLLDRSQLLVSEDIALLKDLNVKQVVVVLNKSDLVHRLSEKDLAAQLKGTPAQNYPHCLADCVSVDGTRALENEIHRLSGLGKLDLSQDPGINSLRQKEALLQAETALNQTLLAFKNNLSAELIAVDVRLTLDHLGTLIGDVYNDDMLDVLFNRFCIGK